jgi:hypothetical protein
VGFDALFAIPPFSVLAELSADVELLRGSLRLMSVHLDATLTGPTPWHVFGKASFKVLFLSASVGFDVTVGPAGQLILPQANPRQPLIDAFKEPGNWSASVPKGAVLVHPFGRLSVRQTVAPLGVRLERFGNATVAGPSKFEIQDAKLGQQSVKRSATEEQFAAAQFFELSDEEKLSLPSFQAMAAGVELGEADAVKAGQSAPLDLDYETQIVESPIERARALELLYAPDGEVFMALQGQGAAAIASAHTSADGKYLAPGTESPVWLGDERLVVVDSDELTVRQDVLAEPGSAIAAKQALDQHLREHPEERDALQVVSVQEAVGA